MERNLIGEYIRTNKRQKVGYLIAFLDREDNVRVGWSLYNRNNEDILFDKYTAKALAYLRCW